MAAPQVPPPASAGAGAPHREAHRGHGRGGRAEAPSQGDPGSPGMARLRASWLLRVLHGPRGTLWAALLVVLAWRVMMTAVSASQGAVFEPLVMTLLAFVNAGIALLPLGVAIALRPRLRWTSGATHAAGFAASALLHAAIWAVDRGGILGDPAFFDRYMLVLVGFVGVVALLSHAHTLQAEGRLRLPERWVWGGGLAVAMAFLVLAAALPAAAHTPAYPVGVPGFDDPMLVPGATGSWALLGHLPAGGVAVVARDLPVGTPATASLATLAREDARGFQPSLAVVGPGLPRVGTAPPVPLPADWGWVTGEAWQGRTWEGFTEVPMFKGPAMAPLAVVEARYRFVVWDPAGGGGDYVLALGTGEAMDLGDLHRFPAAYLDWRLRFW